MKMRIGISYKKYQHSRRATRYIELVARMMHWTVGLCLGMAFIYFLELEFIYFLLFLAVFVGLRVLLELIIEKIAQADLKEYILNDPNALAEYLQKKQAQENMIKQDTGWRCVNCGTVNSNSFEYCRKCNVTQQWSRKQRQRK